MIVILIEVLALIVYGRFFSELAFDNDRNRWAFGALGAGAGLILHFFFALVIQFALYITRNGSYFRIPFLVPVIYTCLTSLTLLFVYKRLEKYWEKNPVSKSKDSGLLDR